MILTSKTQRLEDSKTWSLRAFEVKGDLFLPAEFFTRDDRFSGLDIMEIIILQIDLECGIGLDPVLDNSLG